MRLQREGWYATVCLTGIRIDEMPCLVVTGNLDAARRRLAPPPTLPSFRKVAGTCPACSGSTLMLGAGDHVTCSWIGCPDPMSASRRLVPLDDAAIGRAARAIADRFFEYENSEDREFCLETARVALAAAEETPHG